MKKIVIIYGAPSAQSRVRGVTNYYEQALTALGYVVEVIYPQQLPAEALLYADFSNDEIQKAVKLVEEAEGVIVASPVYKAAYSGFVKVFLDMLPQRGLENKIALPVLVGGTIAHMLALDYAFRPVLAALANSHTLQGVFALDGWITKTDNNTFDLTEDLKTRIQDSVQKMVSAL